MYTPDPQRVMQIQKQFIIFVGSAVCTIADAEARGLVEVHVDENTGEVAYSELPVTARTESVFPPSHS
jgi:hypothetical protein